MRQVSDKIKLLFGFSIGLALVLYQFLPGRTQSATTPPAEQGKQIQVNTDRGAQKAQDDEEVDRAVQRLVGFKANQIAEEKPTVSQISRNLFNNDPMIA